MKQLFERLVTIVPPRVASRLDAYGEILEIAASVRDPRVARALGPSALRGLVLQRGKQGVPTYAQASHAAAFDWTYPDDHPEMRALYTRAKQGQWDADTAIDWSRDVDPMNPEVVLLPDEFLDLQRLERYGIKLTGVEKQRTLHSVMAWFLSQFLHGEQGALFAAAQVTEAIDVFDGKLYGATQVMDEGRHVEVFHRYLTTKLEKLYQINDNLFVILDALMTDPRWDMKFLGMQIMVEGLALGAFGTLYAITKEPVLRDLLRYVIRDEARHVHYGVLALRDHYKNLSDRERREREDWAFEVALLMRNRFMAYEVFEEHFEGRIKRSQWREFVSNTPGMQLFRRTMFERLVPNLREVGLVSKRILPQYEKVGLLQYMGGLSADRLTGEKMIEDLDGVAA